MKLILSHVMSIELIRIIATQVNYYQYLPLHRYHNYTDNNEIYLFWVLVGGSSRLQKCVAEKRIIKNFFHTTSSWASGWPAAALYVSKMRWISWRTFLCISFSNVSGQGAPLSLSGHSVGGKTGSPIAIVNLGTKGIYNKVTVRLCVN